MKNYLVRYNVEISTVVVAQDEDGAYEQAPDVEELLETSQGPLVVNICIEEIE